MDVDLHKLFSAGSAGLFLLRGAVAGGAVVDGGSGRGAEDPGDGGGVPPPATLGRDAFFAEAPGERAGPEALLLVPTEDEFLGALLGVEVDELTVDGLLAERRGPVRVAALGGLLGPAVLETLADHSAAELVEDAEHLAHGRAHRVVFVVLRARRGRR